MTTRNWPSGFSLAIVLIGIGGCNYLTDAGKAKLIHEQNMPKTWITISNILTRARP